MCVLRVVVGLFSIFAYGPVSLKACYCTGRSLGFNLGNLFIFYNFVAAVAVLYYRVAVLINGVRNVILKGAALDDKLICILYFVVFRR